ncbi:hypothetical protein VKT23_010688 [Stygiomarasmius scandens]|uniref:Uncharacterized protein n=1 Tax=Marasmiellus scandens TaxID=2682957 RepID=A0ABR1JG69_9AGAR
MCKVILYVKLASDNLLQPVQADIAKLIRRRCIAIVPIEATLKLILDHAEAGVQKSSQPKRYTEFFPVRQYEYVFLPLHLEDMLYVEDPASGEMNPLNPPFALPNLPTFVSYAHPYHVTLSSVDAVLSYGKSLSAFPWGKSLVNTFFRLAVIWRSPPPLQVMELPAEDSDSEGLDVSADIMTPPGTPLIKDSRTYHTFYSGQMIDIGSVSENTGSSQIRI